MRLLHRQAEAVPIAQGHREAQQIRNCHRLHRLARKLQIPQADWLRGGAYYRDEQMEQHRAGELHRL